MTSKTNKKNQSARIRNAGDMRLQDMRIAICQKVGNHWVFKFYADQFALPDELKTENQVKNFMVKVLGFDGVEFMKAVPEVQVGA